MFSLLVCVGGIDSYIRCQFRRFIIFRYKSLSGRIFFIYKPAHLIIIFVLGITVVTYLEQRRDINYYLSCSEWIRANNISLV